MKKLKGTLYLLTILAVITIAILGIIAGFEYLLGKFEKNGSREYIFFNILFLLFAGFVLLGIVRVRKKRIFRETMSKILGQKRAAISFYVILAYFFVGSLNMVYLPKASENPGSSVVTSQSFLDYIFSFTTTETTYSAPFAKTDIKGKTKTQRIAYLGNRSNWL